MSDRHEPLATETETEAALWLARLHADDRSRRDDRAFRRWLDADAAHRDAFDRITEAWESAGAIGRRPYAVSAGQGPRVGRRTLILGGGGVLVAGAGAIGWSAAAAGVYETHVGEQRHVTLEDGSLLFLDTGTRVRARFDRTARTVLLDRGRCNFRIAPDRDRAFVVEAGTHRVTTPRATFDVRRDGDVVAVTCLSGATSVDMPGAGGRPGMVTAGERLVVAPGRTARIDTPDLGAAIAWQSGQIVFDGDSLADAAAEMNRYSPSKLIVDDPRVATLKLSGSYRVGDNIAFAQSLARFLPVRISRQGTSIELASLA